ncbi:hypothetical protein F2P81_002511 [Scophthalmus maximus]|uniref:Uncharacterized protein n=1 Tax=Scophthalmus maximus TaxID=52904 RepID=A0A6A4TVD2_SCOMX|nr:hypothetical protein F2P81_002511 [Scophthalmus maximus]
MQPLKKRGKKKRKEKLFAHMHFEDHVVPCFSDPPRLSGIANKKGPRPQRDAARGESTCLTLTVTMRKRANVLPDMRSLLSV